MIAIAIVCALHLIACTLLTAVIPLLYHVGMSEFMLLPNQRRLSGLEAAAKIIRSGLKVRVLIDEDYLEDRYGPEAGVLHISLQTATYTSLGALAIIAHEMAHATQRLSEAGTAAIAIASGLYQVYRGLRTIRWLLLLSGLTLTYIKEPFGFLLIALATFMCIPGIVGAWANLMVERDATTKGLQLLRQNLLAYSQDLVGIKRFLAYGEATYKLELLRCIAELLFFVALAVTVAMI